MSSRLSRSSGKRIVFAVGFCLSTRYAALFAGSSSSGMRTATRSPVLRPASTRAARARGIVRERP